MPNYWLNKSDVHLDAAQKLKDNPNNHHAPSIGCAYYACYLRLTHSLNVVLGYTEGRFNVEFNSFKTKSNGQGSHDFLIHLVYTRISGRDRKDASDFKNDMLALKTLRVAAQYKNEWQEKDKSDLAFNKASAIFRVLKKNNL